MRRLNLLLILALAGCGKKHSDPPPTLVPGAAQLVSPQQNAVCTTGTNLSATESVITFTWTPGANNSSYEVVTKNLLTNTLDSLSSNTNQVKFTLKRGVPFAWYVVSKSSSSAKTAKSDTWKFYIAGEGTIFYPPFPATLISPIFAQSFPSGTTSINLTWGGSDADSDIVDYDVYLGTTGTPALFKDHLTQTTLNNIAVSPNSTYYWRIVTRDGQGNTSNSEIFQFVVH